MWRWWVVVVGGRGRGGWCGGVVVWWCGGLWLQEFASMCTVGTTLLHASGHEGGAKLSIAMTRMQRR